jgi:CBS domain-containing protein
MAKAKAKAKAAAAKSKVSKNDPYDVDDYLGAGLDEEAAVMAERARAPRVFDSATLRAPIKTLPYHKPVTVKPSATIAEAVAVMQKGHFGCVLVVEKGKPVGIFTERDVLFKLAGKGKDWKKAKIEEYMTPDPDCLPDDASFAFALNMMTEGGYRHIPIVDRDGKAISILSIKDVVRYICGFFEKEIQNLPPRPNLLHPTAREQGGG